jgi:single-stranded-DNA-specific exonuclease
VARRNGAAGCEQPGLVNAGLRRAGRRGCAGLRALIEVASVTPRLCQRHRLCNRPRINGQAPGGHGARHQIPGDGRFRGAAGSMRSTRSTASDVPQQMTDEAEHAWAPSRLARTAAAPCVSDPEWHPGVVGLVASKMEEPASPGDRFCASRTRRRRLRGS